jgi:GxxExxY protein
VNINEVTAIVIDSAMEVHTVLGPGLLESAYESCLKHELVSRNIKVSSQLELPITYKNNSIDSGYRIDLLVDDRVIVELKAVDRILPIHEAQLLSYLKMSNLKIGLLLNFNVTRLKHGIKRLAN